MGELSMRALSLAEALKIIEGTFVAAREHGPCRFIRKNICFGEFQRIAECHTKQVQLLLPTPSRLASLFTHYYSANVLSPLCQRVADLALILCAIIHPRHSRLVAAHVVQYRLNYVWQNSKPVGHHCGTGSAEVVETPRQALGCGVGPLACFENSLIKRSLCLRPTREPPLVIAVPTWAFTENIVTIRAARRGSNERQGGIGKRYYVRTVVLGSGAGDRP